MAIPNWLTLATESGNSGTTIVSLTAATNPTENERIYALTVRNDNTGLSRIVNIIQGTKVNYAEDFFTIEVIEGNGYLTTSSANTIWVSEDTDLENWTLLKSSGSYETLYQIEEGKAYCLRGSVGENQPIFYSPYPNPGGPSLSVYGNIKSVYGGMESGSPINLTNAFNWTNSQGYGVNNCIVDAENLIIEPLSGQVFTRMFYNCANLEVPPQLPVVANVPDNGYAFMFAGCASLTQTPFIYGRTLGNNCCEGMFSQCYSLETPPQLQATSMGDSCCDGMFWYCTALTITPIISATTIGERCFEEMFFSCHSLEDASTISIPVTNTLCCYNMFNNCTSLTTTPELPATTVAPGSYQQMFVGCTSLTSAPELPAISATSNCYSHMFSGCTSLNYIKCLAEYLTPNQGESVTDSVESWVSYVAPVGLFLKSPNMNDWGRGNSGIPIGWIIGDADITQYIYLTTSGISVNCVQQEKSVSVFSSSEWSYTTTANWLSISRSGDTLTINISKNTSDYDRTGVINITNTEGLSNSITIIQEAYDYGTENFTIQMLSNGNISSSGTSNKTIEWCVNNGEWITGSSADIDVVSGDIVEFKSANKDYTFGWTFNVTGLYKVFGNIMSLQGDATYLNNYQFQRLFEGNTGLTTAENLILPDFTAGSCYQYMFSGCTSLTTAPAISNLSSSSCALEMFAGCSSLNYIKCTATSFGRTAIVRWVQGVSPTGTFVKASGVTWESGDNGIPNGWTVQEV